jgi:catechol 2,3-dioxygenase-like lactoylglutathione lyase family enzyme
MIDHLTLRVRDFGQSKAFFLEALRPLGYALVMEFGGNVCGLGEGGKPDFWLKQEGAHHEPMHLAFAAPDRAAVDAFHKAALAAGATDDGAPGLRPQYHPHFYGAFVISPDGHHIEAVCHR